MIHDSTTDRYIVESFAIAQYLDETYPGTPPLFTPGSAAPISLLIHHVVTILYPLIPPLLTWKIFEQINDCSIPYYRKSREALMGCALEDLNHTPEKRLEYLEKLKAGFDVLSKIYDTNGPESIYFFGTTFTFADAVVAGALRTLVIFFPDAEVAQMKSWDNGRWGKLIDETERFCGP